MRPHGRARLSRRHPEASGVCDRCGVRITHIDLEWQHDWQGMQLVNRRILVCRRCLDEPSSTNRTVRIPPDNIPVRDPRPLDLTNAETNYLTDQTGHPLVDDLGVVILVS